MAAEKEQINRQLNSNGVLPGFLISIINSNFSEEGIAKISHFFGKSRYEIENGAYTRRYSEAWYELEAIKAGNTALDNNLLNPFIIKVK